MIPDSTVGDTWVISGKCKATDIACDTRAITWGNRFLESGSNTFKSLAATPSNFLYKGSQLDSWLASDDIKVGDLSLTSKKWLEVSPPSQYPFF